MEDLKVDDIVEYTGVERAARNGEKPTGKITKIDINKNINENKVWVAVITHPRISVGQNIFWDRKNCRLIQKKEEKEDGLCNCNMQTLMAKGCQCGKN